MTPHAADGLETRWSVAAEKAAVAAGRALIQRDFLAAAARGRRVLFLDNLDNNCYNRYLKLIYLCIIE